VDRVRHDAWPLQPKGLKVATRQSFSKLPLAFIVLSVRYGPKVLFDHQKQVLQLSKNGTLPRASPAFHFLSDTFGACSKFLILAVNDDC
jgi:hypothetical protein